MPTDAEPIEGTWYESIETGESFFVVTVDEEEGVIEIQHYDGATEEIELNDWEELDVEPIDPPADYLGGIEDQEDYDEDQEDYQGEDSEEDWGEPMEELDD